MSTDRPEPAVVEPVVSEPAELSYRTEVPACDREWTVMDEHDIQEAIESYMNIELTSQPPDDDVDWWRLDETGDLTNSPAGQTDILYDIEQEYPEEIPIY